MYQLIKAHLDLITQLNILDSEINQTKSEQEAGNGHELTYYVSFKLNEDDEIERLKQFYNTTEYIKCTKIDLYNVPQCSKPVLKFLEDCKPTKISCFSFNLEGKDIKIDKYIHSLMKRIVGVKDSLSINHCDFDFNSLNSFIEQGFPLFSTLKLLDLSN
jgi:hypothetical protein